MGELRPGAVGFEAQAPAGLARMARWPDGTGGYHGVAEAKNERGWKRFTEHRCRPA
jgi:hypothetical protein